MMRKGKIIVVSAVAFCILFSAAAGLYFLSNNTQLLNPQQNAAILRVAGLLNADSIDETEIKAIYDRRVISRKVNLDSGELLPVSSSSDVQQHCENLAANQDPAQVHQRCNIADIYLIKDDLNQIQQVIIPVSGKGAKSMLLAFISLETDGRTVKNLLYYQQNETPALGAKVADADWLRQWVGKKVLNDNAQPALKIVQQRSGTPDEYTVDGITGATMTSSGVEKSINFWMGDLGYGHFLQRLTKDKGILSH